MTPQQFKDCVKEFRRFGYDPYNSADDADIWHVCMRNNDLPPP